MISLSQPLPEVHLLQPKVFTDFCGDFVKTFNAKILSEFGILFQPVEEFYSISRQDVLRGMHFQLPPHDHDKLVYYIRGWVLDVLVDFRKGSSSFAKAAFF